MFINKVQLIDYIYDKLDENDLFSKCDFDDDSGFYEAFCVCVSDCLKDYLIIQGNILE